MSLSKPGTQGSRIKRHLRFKDIVRVTYNNGQTKEIRFRADDVGRVELETTRTANRAVRGTLIGAGVGIGIAALGFAASDNPDAAGAAALGIGMFGLIGAGIGALVGLASKREIVEFSNSTNRRRFVRIPYERSVCP